MNLNIKKSARLIALVTAFSLTTVSTYASVFGDVASSGAVSMGENTGTYYYNTQFVDGSTHQAEYYFEYTPNENVTPIITNGERLYGRRTLLEAAEYIQENGLIPIMGINADYFSYKTGLPMGHEIIDGELVSKSQEYQQAIGFRADGTAFISPLQIRTELIYDGNATEIGNINKWRQPTSVPADLLTSDFGSSAQTSTDGYVMIFSVVSGSISLQEDCVLLLEETFDYEGDVAIPEDKIIITIDNESGDAEVKAALKAIPIGAEVTITNRDMYNPELWKEAEFAMSSTGGSIIENGAAVSGLSKTREPRSAVGIKADGTVVFYLIDGRQTGYSSGASLVELAERMLELGCVDAINLDGGGSSAIGAVDDTGTFITLNSPSDGSLRKCANYIFLRDNRTPTDTVGRIDIQQEQYERYASGSEFDITFDGIYDTNGFDMYLVDDMTYSITNEDGAESTVSANGHVTALGSGTSTVCITSGEAVAYLVFEVYDPLDFLDIDGHWAAEYIIALADAGVVNGADGYFYPENNVSRAEFAVMLAKYLGLDISAAHTDFMDDDDIPAWARGSVAALSSAGIISGKVDALGNIKFMPNDKLTRAEASVMLAKAIGAVSTANVSFTDSADIPAWAAEYVAALVEQGVITGYDDGTFKPLSNIKRAEAAAMIYKLN